MGKIKVIVHVDAPLSKLLPGVITIALRTFILGRLKLLGQTKNIYMYSNMCTN